MRTNINLNAESYAFLNSYSFKTTEWCKARITALAFPDRTSISLFCLPSLVNATPRYLNFSTCFNDTPPTRREHWTRFLERCSTSIFEMLITLQQCYFQLYCHLMRFGDQIQRKPAKLNHLQKATDKSCIFRSRHTHRFG